MSGSGAVKSSSDSSSARFAYRFCVVGLCVTSGLLVFDGVFHAWFLVFSDIEGFIYCCVVYVRLTVRDRHCKSVQCNFAWRAWARFGGVAIGCRWTAWV
jgi:hypothetical protein